MISFLEGSNKFNFRVGAIILNRDKSKVLLHTIAGYDFYLLPGGRVEWSESCEEAIERELKEELALVNLHFRERLFLENFFSFNGVNYHEISNNFVVELGDEHGELEKLEEFFGVEGEKYIYRWVKIEDIDKFTIKPQVLKQVIKNYIDKFECLIAKEN